MQQTPEQNVEVLTHIKLPDSILAQHVFIALTTNQDSFTLTDHA